RSVRPKSNLRNPWPRRFLNRSGAITSTASHKRTRISPNEKKHFMNARRPYRNKRNYWTSKSRRSYNRNGRELLPKKPKKPNSLSETTLKQKQKKSAHCRRF